MLHAISHRKWKALLENVKIGPHRQELIWHFGLRIHKLALVAFDSKHVMPQSTCSEYVDRQSMFV